MSIVDTWLKFVRGHLVLLAILGAVWLVWRVGWHYIDRTADTAIADAKAKVEAAKAQAGANADLAAKAAKSEADYKALVAQVLASNASLAESIANANEKAAEAKKQVVVESLPDVALEWKSRLSLLPDDLRLGPGGLWVSEPAARTTVSALIDGQTCSQNIAKTEQRYTNDEQRITACDSTVATCQAQVSGLQAQIVSNKQASDAEVKAMKATARRGKIQWFERGLAGGGIGAVLVLGVLGVL